MHAMSGGGGIADFEFYIDWSDDPWWRDGSDKPPATCEQRSWHPDRLLAFGLASLSIGSWTSPLGGWLKPFHRLHSSEPLRGN